MDCLTGYIGVRWCGGEDSESNLYINELPAVSLKSIDSIANSEQKTFLEVWGEVEKRAIRILNTAVVNEFNRRYKLHRIAENIDLGKEVDTTDNQTVAAAKYRGFTVEVGDASSSLQYIHLQSVKVYRKAVGSFTLRVFEVIGEDSVVQLTTKTMTGVVGWNTVTLNEDYFDVEKIFVATDTTAADSAYLLANDCGDCGECCEATVLGAESDLVFAGLTEGSNTYGLSAVIGIRCGFEQVVCNNKSLFATALWYLCGAELMTERMHSDRINRYTTIDLKKASDLRNEFFAQYQTELKAAIDGIQLSTSDCCLECNAQVTMVNNLP